MEHATLALPAINLGFLSRFVADDEGLWKKDGIDVTVQVIQGIGSTNAVIAGSIDFGFASAATITRATARGQHLVALATQSQESGETIVIRKSIADAAHFNPNASLKERGKQVLSASCDDEVAIQSAKPITTAKQLENGDRLNVAAGFLKKEAMLPEYASIIDNEFVE